MPRHHTLGSRALDKGCKLCSLTRLRLPPVFFRSHHRPGANDCSGSAGGIGRRHYRPLAIAVLALAAFNITYRLGSEFLTEWDESLYATTAWEMLRSGEWIGTTFNGTLDYYNSKPPLNVWLIALSFKVFGVSLWSVRLASATSAWLTVALLMAWARRAFDENVALLSGAVLATCFGFLHVHSGRTANTDAIFTLLTVVTVVVLTGSARRPWQRAWLGPILAAAFLLRGFAALMPLTIVLVVEAIRFYRERTIAWRPLAVATALFVAPVGAWAIARWNVDRWRFFQQMLGYDLVARSVGALEGHAGGWWYYLDILQKHQYDWLLAALAAWLLGPARSRPLSRAMRELPALQHRDVVLAAWAAIALIVPSLMRTKLPWYLDTFYPLFAIAVAWVVNRGLSQAVDSLDARRRRAAVAAFAVIVFVAAEGKLLWYSFSFRDVDLSSQAVLIAERERLRGGRVYFDRWNNADAFVARAIAHAEPLVAADIWEFADGGGANDFLVHDGDDGEPDLIVLRNLHGHGLYMRRATSPLPW